MQCMSVVVFSIAPFLSKFYLAKGNNMGLEDVCKEEKNGEIDLRAVTVHTLNHIREKSSLPLLSLCSPWPILTGLRS